MSLAKIQFDLNTKVDSGLFDTSKTSVTFVGLAKNNSGDIVRMIHVVGGETLKADVLKTIESFDKKIQDALTCTFE